MVINARILIGADSSDPDVEFEARDILSVYTNMSVDFVGKELPVDTLSATVNYRVETSKQFKPTDFLGFKSSNDLILETKNEGIDLRTLPFGTPVWFYKGTNLIGKFYLEKAVRTGIKTFELNCISAVGLLRYMKSYGGIYTGGLRVRDVIGAILYNATFPYIIDNDIGNQKVYGWLPFDTCSNNLWQVMIAYNISMLKDDDGTVHFTWFANSDPDEIINVEPSKIYTGGDLALPSIPSAVTVTEHLYREIYYGYGGYDERNDYSVLFDNTEALEPADNELVVFEDGPIIMGTICFDPSVKVGSLSITSMGNQNFCRVSGYGRLLGVPYTHTERVYTLTNPSAFEENVKSLRDVTIISLANSDFVAKRMMKYYSEAEEIANSFVLNNEKCGKRYYLMNPFREYSTGYLESMKINTSSKLKVESKFVTKYLPVNSDSIYTKAAIITSMAGGQSGYSGTYNIPSEVFDKPVEDRRIRVILCGGGNGGAAGENGSDGSDGSYSGATGIIDEHTSGGRGGAAGEPGDGGKIRVIELKGGQIQPSYNYVIGAGGSAGTHSAEPGLGGDTSFGEWSTEMGASSQENGVPCLFDQSYVLGKRGEEGSKGGDGGKWEDSIGVVHTDSEDVWYYVGNLPEMNIGKPWQGKNGAVFAAHSFYGFAEYGYPGGAAAGHDGNQGFPPMILPVGTSWQEPNAGYCAGGTGGQGASANNQGVASGLGQGGAGGHGGGGGGQGGSASTYNYFPDIYTIYGCEDWGDPNLYKGGFGGIGGAGGTGHGGAIMIYY